MLYETTLWSIAYLGIIFGTCEKHSVRPDSGNDCRWHSLQRNTWPEGGKQPHLIQLLSHCSMLCGGPQCLGKRSIHYSWQDNLHYPLTDASLARVDEEKWRLRKKGNGVSFTRNFQQTLMSFNPGWVFLPLLPSISFRKIILVRLFKYDFATRLMWTQITTFNIPCSKHLIKYPLVKRIEAALRQFQQQEPVKLTNQYLYPVGYCLLSGRFPIS